MKLDPVALRYLSDDDFRVLTAVEMGMRNHDLVPVALISAISGLRHGGSMKSLKEIHKHKLVHRETKGYVGFRLTSLGYDFLAMRALVKRGVIESVGRSVGVGKEADVFMVSPSERLYDEVPDLSEQPHLAMKLHRLGRTSFRNVKSKRDYLCHRKAASWIYFSRLAAIKEYAFMCALHERGFPVPRPLGHSRHVVIMELIDGVQLSQIMEIGSPLKVAATILGVIENLALHGLVHCDLNEFNIILDDDEKVTVIDFPQMVSTQHADAEELFKRDVDGIVKFFSHKYGFPVEAMKVPVFADVMAAREAEERLDVLVSASGFKAATDDGEHAAEETAGDSSNLEGLDMTTLAILDEENDENVDGEPSVDKDEVGADAGPNASGSMPVADDDGGLNRRLIAERVRKQRANQQRRRQVARRNVVKNSEKRKVKAEMASEIWQ